MILRQYFYIRKKFKKNKKPDEKIEFLHDEFIKNRFVYRSVENLSIINLLN